jgi:transposase
MPPYLKLATHLTNEELEGRYRREKDAVTRSHWHILWLISTGKHTREISEVTGYSIVWIRSIIHRYNAQGPDGVGDGRHHNPGTGRLLNAVQEAELGQALEAAQAAGESWNGPQVAAWMSQKLGREVYKARGWETLRRLGYTSKTPRPRHAKADVAAQAQFKKTSA